MLPPKKNTNGLTESDNKVLISELTKYANEGASDQELKEFRDTFINAKKKSTASSTSTATPQKSASAPSSGSLASLGPKDPLSPVQPFTQQPAATKKTPAAKSTASQYPEGSMAWTHAKRLETDPNYKLNYQRFKEAEAVPEEKIAQIRQEVDDEANNVGFINSARTMLAKGASMLPSWMGGTSGKDIDPLYKEKEQAKKELQQINDQARKQKAPEIPVDEKAIAERAKNIKVNNRIKSERDSQVRSFLTDLENTAYGKEGNARKDLMVFEAGEKSTLQEKDKTLLKKQNILRPAIEASASEINELQKQAKTYVQNNQPVPEELKNNIQSAAVEYEDLLKDAVSTHEEYVNNRENLGSAIDNLNEFKRDYSWSKNFENNILSSTTDLIGGLAGFGDYIGSNTPAMPGATGLAVASRGASKKLKGTADSFRDEVMEPISVDNIESFEDFGKWLSNTAVAQQVPIFLATATGAGGIGVLGASATGNKYEEMKAEMESGQADYSEAQLAAIPLAFGATETLSATVDRMLLKNAARTIASATAPERKLMAEGFWSNLKNGATKIGGESLKGAAIEGADEAGTQIAQNILDKYAGNKDVGILDGVKDSGAAGAVMGAFIPFGANIVSRAVKPFSTDTQVQKSAAEIEKYKSILANPELSESTRAITKKQLDAAESKMESEVKKSVSNMQNLSNEEFQEILTLEKEQASLKAQAKSLKNDTSLSEGDRTILESNLESEFNKNNERRLEILNKPANETNQPENKKPETQPQAEAKEKSNEVDSPAESNNSQISEPSNNEASLQTSAEIPNSNQINNESTQGDNTGTDGNIQPGVSELGAVGEAAGQTGEANIGESAQPAVDAGTSEGQPEIGSQNADLNENNINFASNQTQNGTEETTVTPNASPQSELRGSEKSAIGKEVSNRIRESLGAAQEKLEVGKELSRFDKEDIEKKAVFDYAKEKGLWIDDLYSLGDHTGISGNENTLALNYDTGKLYKSNNLFNSNQSIDQLLNQVEMHNELFPETAYEIEGFTGIDKGTKPPYIEVILSQDFLPDAEKASAEEIKAYMESRGFEEITPASFTNGEFTVSDLHPRNVLKDANGTIYVIDDIITRNETPKTEDRPANFEKKKGKKSLVNRIYEGETSESFQNVAEDLGLTYEVENQEEAQKAAKTFVEKVGITKALEAARTGLVKGAEKAFVYAEVLDRIAEAVENSEPGQTEDMESQYLTVLNEATDMFDQEARDSGRFISALNRIYNTSKIKYSLSRQIDKYKAFNDGKIDDATLAKFKEADAKIKELEKQIEETVRRAEEAEAELAMQNIVEAADRETKSSKSAKQRAKTLANKIRKAKINRPDVFNASVGADKIWDTAIEIVAKIIEAEGTLEDAISKGVAYIKKSNWYKGLTEKNKSEAIRKYEEFFTRTNTDEVVTVEDGVIYIPNSVIRTLVEMGVRDIDTLSQKILDMVSEEHTEITLRNVRDAITKYGKTINPTKDAIQKEINLMKRLGRLISAMEDVDGGNRPLRTGLQREKPTQQERKMQRELREKLKDLPLDHADLETEWKNSLDTIKSRLRNQIEDLEKQIAEGEKRKPERTTIAYDEEASLLRTKRDELRALLDEMTGKPELTDEQKVQRAITQMERSIEKLEKQIEAGDIGFNPRPKPLSSEQLTALRDVRNKLVDQLNEMRDAAGLTEQKKLQQAKDRVQKRIDELQDKIRRSDYAKKEPKPVKEDSELAKLRAEKIKWQEVYDRAVYEIELKNRTPRQKAREAFIGALNIFRILKATGELSPVLIQGGIQTVNLAVRKPKTLAKAFQKLFVALGSARKSEQYDAEMKADPNYGTMKASKLALVEPDYKLELREEQFIGNYINNIWNFIGKALENISGKVFGVTETLPLNDKLISLFKEEYKNMPKKKISEQFKDVNPLLALERGLTTYMNQLRMDRFNDGIKMLEMEGKNIADNKVDYEKVARAINTMTGRANMPKSLVQATPILGAIFFSFRNTLSVINQINPVWYALQKDYSKNGDKWYKPSVAQKMAVYDMMRFITITTSMMYLYQAAAGDDEEGNPIIEIETDPRSSDFMKMKQGNMRFDAFHGMIPMVVFFCRQFKNETKSNGEIKELGTGRFTPSRLDLLINLGANKLSPQAGIGWRFLGVRYDKDGNRVNKFGDPYDVAEELSVTPIYIESLKEISKEDPDAYARFLAFMGAFGINSSVYESNPKKAVKAANTKNMTEEAKKRAQEKK